jgi:hypothetical protein
MLATGVRCYCLCHEVARQRQLPEGKPSAATAIDQR